MTCAPLRGIPLSRHLEKFSQIFRAERLLATHCLSAVCEFASRAIHKRRRKSKKIDMPGPWSLSQVSTGHVENSFVFLHFAVFSCLPVNHRESELSACELSAHVAPVKAIAIHVEQPTCTDSFPSGIKVQVCPLVPADLWQIFVSTANHSLYGSGEHSDCFANTV